jgi:hypothetical protein
MMTPPEFDGESWDLSDRKALRWLWKIYSGIYGFEPTDFEKRFKLGRENFRIVGWAPQNRVYSVLTLNDQDEVQCFEPETVRRALRKLPQSK